MEAKDIGRIIGATALAVIPAAGGLYAFGKMKDKKQDTGPAALVGGLAMTMLGVGVALINYYMLGFNETAEQIASLIDEKKASSSVGALLRPNASFSSGSYSVGSLPRRVVGPFTEDIRQVGLLNVQRGRVGLLDVQRGNRVGCCGR